MSDHFHDTGSGKGWGLLLSFISVLSANIGHFNHNEVTMYISNVAGACAIIHYINVFYKSRKNKGDAK